MGKKHKKHRKHAKYKSATQEKELNLKLSIPLSSLPKFRQPSSDSRKFSESKLSCKIQIQKADFSTFIIPKKKEPVQDANQHVKKHKKRKHHHLDDKLESKHHTLCDPQSDSTVSEKLYDMDQNSTGSVRKLSMETPKLTSSPVTISSVMQEPLQSVRDDSKETTQAKRTTTAQAKPASVAELLTAKFSAQQLTSSEQCPEESEEHQKLRTNVKYALKTIHYQLVKKDPQGIFANPVTDDIAPGYSALIPHPMDFSTLSKKIDNLQYQSINEYKDDFILMCNNCMTYNPEDTLFYQAAKKLLASGIKLIVKEAAKRTDLLVVPAAGTSRSSTPLSFHASVGKHVNSPAPSSTHEPPMTRTQRTDSLICRIPLSVLSGRGSLLGSAQDVTALLNTTGVGPSVTDTVMSSTAQWVADAVSAAPVATSDTNLTKLRVGWTGDSDTNSDASSDEEYDNVLEQVQAAAASAHTAAARHHAVDLAYLDTSEAGKARLNILNPDGGSAVKSVDVNMTQIEEAIAEGEEAKKKLELEHSRHKTTPVAYLMYGPYGAFAPYFDSSFATLTRMDSSLLYSVYGDDTGVTYAHSIQRFVRGTNSFACEMAEAILNGLTSNKHRLLKEKLTEQRDKLFHFTQQQQQNREVEDDSKSLTDDQANESCKKDIQQGSGFSSSNVNATSTDTITAATAPVSSLQHQATEDKHPQPTLDKNVEILLQLQQLQNERLSRAPMSMPHSQETNAALQVADNLKQLTSKVTPGEVASVQALRNAMDITTSSHVTTPTTIHEF